MIRVNQFLVAFISVAKRSRREIIDRVISSSFLLSTLDQFFADLLAAESKLMTIWALRFLDQDASSLPRAIGRFSP